MKKLLDSIPPQERGPLRLVPDLSLGDDLRRRAGLGRDGLYRVPGVDETYHGIIICSPLAAGQGPLN